MNRLRKWRVIRLGKKIDKLREEFKWAYENRELLGYDYDKFTDIIAGQINYYETCKKRILLKLQRKDKQNG